MKTFYKIECGLLPLRHRFVRVTLGETQWIMRAKIALDLATAYYAREGWYEDDDLIEDRSLKQPVGRDLRGVVETNADLQAMLKWERWSTVRPHAQLIAGPEVTPPNDDQLWWFEEQGGRIEEVTDLPLPKQKPYGPLWFSDAWARENGVKVPA